MQTLKLTSKSVTKETKVIQISDAHIIVPDKNDGEIYKIEKERKLFFERESLLRTGEVRYAEEELAETIEYAKSADLTVFTGDIVEFATQTNVDRMMMHFANCKDYLYTFGNHDYLKCYLNAENPEKQRAENGALFRKAIKNDIEFTVKTVNGVNIVVMDNSTCQFSERQYEELKKVLSEDNDAILFMHMPLYHPALDIIGQKKVNVIAVACGVNYDLSSPKYPTETTKKTIELIKENHKKVLALMTGDHHYTARINYYENIIECVCAPTYLHDFYEIVISREKAE
ncbi:MAG: metallophosphoesterase [Clostridia bacterium]|nr:metallophosphoesterase [Clostridia bacterium]